MVSAVRPLRSLSMARGCAWIDSRPDTAKIGSADRVEVHHARLLAVIGVRKTFPHGLGQTRTSSLGVARPLPPSADIGPGRSSAGQAAQFCLGEGNVIADRVGQAPRIFLAGLYRAERAIAGRLMRLANGTLPWPWIDPDKALPWVEKHIGLTLAESQVTAIERFDVDRVC